MKSTEFANHPIWADLKALQGLLRKVDEQTDPSVSSRLDGIRELLAETQSFQEAADSRLFSANMIVNVHNCWVSIQNQLTQYISNPAANESYLHAAIGQLDTLLDQLATWPRPQGNPQARAQVTRAMNGFREQLDESRKIFKARLDEVLEESAEREAKLVEQIDGLRETLTATSQSVDALDTKITKDEARLDTALTTSNEAFNASQTVREKSFQEWLKAQEADFSELAQPHLDSILEAEQDAVKRLAEITALRTSTVEMANLAAGDILADQYADSAKVERRAAYWAYGIGGLAAIGSILIILFAFGWFRSEALDWPQVVLKLSLTAVAGGIATVAFRFAGQATKRTTSFKRQELELRALQPFLKGVDGADKAKTAFLDRAFGHAWADGSIPAADTETNELLMKIVTAAIQNLGKPANSTPPVV